MQRGGRRKEMTEEMERLQKNDAERERLPKARPRPTLASGSLHDQQQEHQAGASKQEKSGVEVDNMIATVQDLLRPA